MPGNTIGTFFRLTTFGESHGLAIGGVVDGCPPNIPLTEGFIQQELDLRKPADSTYSTNRREGDRIELLSGVFEGVTTGMPIGFLIRNEDQKTSDYDHLKDIYRPSHADYAVEKRYGIRDHRGGGRLSGRETTARVAGGAVAKAFLLQEGIEVTGFVSSIGNIDFTGPVDDLKREDILSSPLRCPGKETSAEMARYLDGIARSGDTAGGIVTCLIRNVKAGLGDPVFDKLHADLGKAMLSIGGARGFEIGEGFGAARMKGSEHNDEWECRSGEFRTATNRSGGVQGGISNGETIICRVAFKPVSSVAGEQRSVDRDGKEVTFSVGGRHDVCVVPRAVPVVEAMAALVMADHLIRCKGLNRDF